MKLQKGGRGRESKVTLYPIPFSKFALSLKHIHREKSAPADFEHQFRILGGENKGIVEVFVFIIGTHSLTHTHTCSKMNIGAIIRKRHLCEISHF